MLSVTEMLEKFPSAKMDEHKEVITIPIEEYENYRNITLLQDKQSIIRDLQHLLLDKEKDLQRYREKCEQTESVLQRTQKALDKRIQIDPTQYSIPLKSTVTRQQPGIIPLKRSDSRPNPTTPNTPPEIVARAVGDKPKSDSTPLASLPNPNLRSVLREDSAPLKSLPLNLSIGSPGMSTALFKRLVQENLRLKTQLDRRNLPKATKDPEKIINDLKLKLAKKQQLLDDLMNQGGSQGQDHITNRLTQLDKENDEFTRTIEMNKIVITSLKQDNIKIHKEKEEMENLLIQYRKFQTDAEGTNEKIADLESRLNDEVDNRKVAENKLESYKTDLETMNQTLKKALEDRELAVKNYNTLCEQFRTNPERPSAMQSAYKIQAPQLGASQAMPLQAASQPSSLTTQHPYSLAPSPTPYGEVPRLQPRGGITQPQSLQYSVHSPLHRRANDSIYARQPVPQSTTQPMQESSMHRMSQSTYAPPAAYQSAHQPLPTERKTFRCPRCDHVFSVLQGYRDHIKICLKG